MVICLLCQRTIISSLKNVLKPLTVSKFHTCLCTCVFSPSLLRSVSCPYFSLYLIFCHLADYDGLLYFSFMADFNTVSW